MIFLTTVNVEESNMSDKADIGTGRKKGIAHYLHQQWVQTTTGREAHAKLMAEAKAKPSVPRTGKGGKRI